MVTIDIADLVLFRPQSPVLQEPRCLRGDLPLVWIWQVTPLVNELAQLIDDRSRVVRLSSCRETEAFVEDHRLLIGRGRALLRLGNRSDEVSTPAGFDDPLRRLALVVQLPVARRPLVGRVKDGVIKERIRHKPYA